MAAESNTGLRFQHEQSLESAAMNRHAIWLQSNAINSTSETIPVGNYYGVSNSAVSIMFSGNFSIPGSSNNMGITQAGNSSGSLLLDSVPGLTHDAGLAVEWSAEEQYKLEEGLDKYADEPSIMKYIKIAAMLHDKTVRDVALRCRWMTRKRMKPEDQNLGKKMRDRKKGCFSFTNLTKEMTVKDKLVESALRANISSALSMNMPSYSFLMNQQGQSNRMSCETLSGSRHLLEQNIQVLEQISANISALKLQNNIDLFLRSRNNITAILNDMRNVPGIMSQMSPLNVSINEELVNNILTNATSQTLMFGSRGIQLRQEPGC